MSFSRREFAPKLSPRFGVFVASEFAERTAKLGRVGGQMSPLTKSLESIATALQVRHRELVLTRNRSELAEIKVHVARSLTSRSRSEAVRASSQA